MSQVRGSNRTPIHTGCRAEEINMNNNNNNNNIFLSALLTFVEGSGETTHAAWSVELNPVGSP